MRLALKNLHKVAIFLTLLPVTAVAQTNEVEEFALNLPRKAYMALLTLTPETYLKRFEKDLERYETNGAWDEEILIAQQMRRRAVARARFMQQFLAFDTDENFVISLEELESQRSHIDAELIEKAEFLFDHFDENSDLEVSLAELQNAFLSTITEQSYLGDLAARMYMSFDLDQDGSVDLDEMQRVINAIPPEILKSSGAIMSHVSSR